MITSRSRVFFELGIPLSIKEEHSSSLGIPIFIAGVAGHESVECNDNVSQLFYTSRQSKHVVWRGAWIAVSSPTWLSIGNVELSAG